MARDVNQVLLKQSLTYKFLNNMEDWSVAETQRQPIDTQDKLLQKRAALSSQSALQALHDKHLNIDYKLIRMIGKGAMSRVYLAERKADNQLLVLKLLDIKTPAGDASIEQFMYEARLVAELHSPSIVNVFEYGTSENYAFIAMEFLSHGNLTQRIGAKKEINPALALKYMIQIIKGLGDIHQVNVVHRDIKPANIMFRDKHNITLTDFGIATKVDPTTNDSVSETGQVIGTPVYMSPEQGQGLAVDGRTDIYSAGVIFYELLTTEKPFFAIEPHDVIDQHINKAIPKLPQHLQRFQGVVSKMMAKDVAERYQLVSEIMPVLLELTDQ